MSYPWSRAGAVDLCRQLEAFAPQFGCHVALTGGCLYKEGLRKDADIIVYRIRQAEQIDTAGFFTRMANVLDIHIVEDHGFCVKAENDGRSIDFLFPEAPGDYYGGGQEPDLDLTFEMPFDLPSEMNDPAP